MAPKSWFRKGGYDVPLFVPHTPGEKLVRRTREKEAENNQGRKVRFKIVGRGAEEVKPVGRKQVRSGKVLPLQGRRWWRLLEGECML